MSLSFKRIALMGRYSTRSAKETLNNLLNFLNNQPVEVFLESETAEMLENTQAPTVDRLALAETVDLVMVVGGDGSLLNAARALADSKVPVMGINRGMLGFLTDISPDDFERPIMEVLEGQYTEEKRFFLTASMQNNGDSHPIGDALNDVVLYAGEVARMIEFELYIDGDFVYSQKSDGLIISTPTGSTAYALSGGGPILHPTLEAIVLVPMFPHTLTSRPIAINSSSEIELRIAKTHSGIHPGISCDGQQVISLSPGAKLIVKRKTNPLRLIHPMEYDYYHTLRTKLEWGSKLQGKHFPKAGE